jgi:hypothetical protein
VVTFSEARSQWRKVRFDTWSLRWATLTVIREPQIHLPNPSYVDEEDEFIDEKFQEDEFVDKEFKHKDVEDPSQGFVDWVLHQPMILISMMEILWEVLCHMIKRKNL